MTHPAVKLVICPVFTYDTDAASFPYYSAGLRQPIKITVIKRKVLIAPFIIIHGHIRQLAYLPGNSHRLHKRL